MSKPVYLAIALAIAALSAAPEARADDCMTAVKKVQTQDLVDVMKSCSNAADKTRDKIRWCMLDKLAARFPSSDAKCFQDGIAHDAEFINLVKGLPEAAPTGNSHCQTEDPQSHKCICGDAEYTQWKRDTDYNPSDFEKVAVEAFVTPLTIGMGFDAVQFIKLIKQFAGALQKPHCFARLMDTSAKQLRSSVDDVLKQYDWHRWSSGPDAACAVPVEAWMKLGNAFSKSEFYNYVPGALQPGVQALVVGTTPLVCSAGLTLWANKAAAEKLITDFHLPEKLVDLAFEKVLGADVHATVLAMAHVQLGSTHIATEYAQSVQAMADAVGKQDRAAYDAAKATLRQREATWLKIDDDRFLGLVVQLVRDGGDKGIDSLRDLAKEKMKELTKQLIQPWHEATATSIGSVPYVGGLLVGVFGVVEDYSLDAFYGMLLDWIVPLVKQGYSAAVDALAPKLATALRNGSPSDRATFQSLFVAVRQVRDEMDRDRRDLVAKVDASIAAFDRAMGVGVPTVTPPAKPPITPPRRP